MNDRTLSAGRVVRDALLVVFAAGVGALVNGYVVGLTTSARLSVIELRLTNVERELNRITCLQVRGAANCSEPLVISGPVEGGK